MERFGRYIKPASFIVAFVLFALPIISPPTPLDFFADHMALSALFVLGLGAGSWREALATGVVFGMLALAIYAYLGFGWIDATLSEAELVPDQTWGDAMVDILIWAPAISAMAVSVGYALRLVLGAILKRLILSR